MREHALSVAGSSWRWSMVSLGEESRSSISWAAAASELLDAGYERKIELDSHKGIYAVGGLLGVVLTRWVNPKYIVNLEPVPKGPGW